MSRAQQYQALLHVKGALNKYNIYLFMYNSEIKSIPKFAADSANAFSFYEVFSEKHHLQSVP